MDWGRRWAVALAALLVLPLAVWAISWIVQGWVPQGDEAWIALRTHDVFTAHPPLQGMRSTSAQSWPGVWAHHPGPMQVYLLAVPYAVAGYRPAGLVIGDLLLATALIVLAMTHGWQAGRRRGLTAVVVAVLVCELLVGPSLVMPWNTWPPVLGVVTLLVLVWRLLLGHMHVLPWFAVVGSLVLQADLALVAMLLPLLLTLAGVGFVHWQRLRGAVWPLSGWRTGHRVVLWRRPGVVAVALTLVCWAPSIVELFEVHPNNASQLWAIASRELHGPLHIVGAVLLVAACCWAARAIAIQGSLAQGSAMQWMGGLVAAGIVLSIAAGGGGRLLYLFMMLGGVAFVIAAQFRWQWLVRKARVVPPAAWAVVALAVALAIGPGGPAALSFNSDQVRNADRARVVTHQVDAALRARGFRGGPVVVRAEGTFSIASYVSAVIVALTVEGYTPYYDHPWPKPEDDDFRRTQHAPPDAPEVVLVDGRPPVVRVSS